MKVPAAFYNVSPYWAKAIGDAKTVRDLAGFKGYDEHTNYHETQTKDGMHNLSQGGSCIVGEAHGMSAEYWNVGDNLHPCEDCSMYSRKFYDILVGEYDHLGNRKQLIQDNIQGFTMHWRGEHDPLIGIVPHVDIVQDEPLKEHLAGQIKAK